MKFAPVNILILIKLCSPTQKIYSTHTRRHIRNDTNTHTHNTCTYAHTHTEAGLHVPPDTCTASYQVPINTSVCVDWSNVLAQENNCSMHKCVNTYMDAHTHARTYIHKQTDTTHTHKHTYTCTHTHNTHNNTHNDTHKQTDRHTYRKPRSWSYL